jgi:uncharacterized protein YgiB involved in biofilm formation
MNDGPSTENDRKRKRSQRVRLVWMTSLLPFVLPPLTGCSRPTIDAVAFADVQECHAHGYTDEDCRIAWQLAGLEQQSVAPHYLQLDECEADFGVNGCEPTLRHHAGGSYFMPIMAGFLAGRLSAAQPGMPSRLGNQAAVPVQPLYRSRDDRQTLRTARNVPITARTGPLQVTPAEVQTAPAFLARRGGFGQQAAVRMAPHAGTGT